MIVRMWTGRARGGAESDYVAYLEEHVFPEIRAVPGSLGARVLRDPSGVEREFLVLTEWTDLEAVKAFAGPDPDVAVVPEAAQALLASYDARVRHLEVVLESE